MEKSEQQGMQTFDGHLYRLYREKKISLEEALRNADSASNLKLRINLSPTDSSTTDGTATGRADHLSAFEGLSLEPKAEEVEEAV
jgi:twitching motility protein PilU